VSCITEQATDAQTCSARRVFLIVDMVPPIAVSQRPTGSAPSGRISFWSIRRSMPFGSTRSPPSDFANRADLERDLLAFRARYQRAAKPFKRTVTHHSDFHALLTKLMPRRASPHKPRPPNTSPQL
jgi:hypothetical protein